MKVKTFARTCYACPSQWNMRLDDGQYVYVRYRWGSLTVGVGNTHEAAVSNDDFDKEAGDALDGFMTDSEMQQHLTDWGFDFSEAVREGGEPVEEFTF